jgi:hypothetical protein
MIPLEIAGPTVEGVAVDLYHEPPIRPVQIDLVTGNSGIHQRSGKASPVNQSEHPLLRFRPRQLRLPFGLEQSPKRTSPSSSWETGKEGTEIGVTYQPQGSRLVDRANETAPFQH